MVRCFLAINLSTETEKYLSKSIERFRLIYHKKVKWVKPKNCHITLKFLGNVNEHLIVNLKQQVKRVSSNCNPFEIELSRTGVFPNLKAPRVLWFGLKGELATLRQLQSDIDQKLSVLGFEPDCRAFTPHITIGRIKARSLKAPDLEDFLRINPPLLKTLVKEIHLYQSILHPSGPEYRSISQFPLIKGH